MNHNYEDIKNVFIYEKDSKGKIKKFFIIDGIFAIILTLLAFVYNEESDFAIKFFGILFIIISFLIAVAILLEQKANKTYKILKNQKKNIENYLIDRYKFELENDLMMKRIDKIYYTLEYNLGVVQADLARKGIL